MEINGGALHTSQVNGIPEIFWTGEGQVAYFTQSTRSHTTAVGEILSINQETQTTASGNILTIDQEVKVNTATSYLERNGFKPRVAINGYILPDNQICGVHKVIRGEGDAAILEFEIQPPSGAVDLASYQGAAVTYDILRPSGAARIFTGVVNIPDVDLINKRIKLSCTDKREEQMNSQLSFYKQYIGNYSERILGASKDTAEEVSKRLTTVPYSIDFNAYGQWRYTAWAAKGTADYTLGDSTIYYREPKVIMSSRARITNQVVIDLQYRYPRLHHLEQPYTWQVDYTVCQFLVDGYTQTSRAMVQAAVDSVGWPLKGEITYTDPFNSGSYGCNGVTIIYSNIEYQGTTIGATTTNPTPGGDPVPVIDSSGNQVQKAVVTRAVDHTKEFCTAAYFTLATQWAQTMVEKFTLTINAPQSQTQYGTISVNESLGVDTDYNTGQWESYPAYRPAAAITNQEPNLTDFVQGSLIAINQAKTRILAAHRDTRVVFERSGWEAVDLTHTVALTATTVTCKGKVQRIIHTIDVEEGEFTSYIELAISRASGSQAESAITPPTRVTDAPTVPAGMIHLGNHFGQDPTTTAAQSWTGMIGNKWDTALTGTGTNRFKTVYPVSFVVDAPAIPAQFRQERILTAAQAYNIAIPNDTLTVTL